MNEGFEQTATCITTFERVVDTGITSTSLIHLVDQCIRHFVQNAPFETNPKTCVLTLPIQLRNHEVSVFKAPIEQARVETPWFEVEKYKGMEVQWHHRPTIKITRMGFPMPPCEIVDNGPTISIGSTSPVSYTPPTMTLRDHFAGLAITGALSRATPPSCLETLAHHAYQIADDMIKRREQ